MKNLDGIKAQKEKILAKFSSAIKEEDNEAFAKAWVELADNIQQSVVQEAQALATTNDVAVLAQRGIRQLTSEENSFYNKVIDATKVKNAVTLIDEVLPKTVVDEIFTYLTENHPILNEVDFQNTGLITQWITSTSSGVAGWGELTDTIKDELAGTFAVVDLSQKKLSAFMPVSTAMLDLGPVWLDRYVRTLLAEALATALELAIVDGTGKGEPIGMTRALTGAVDGTYPQKTPVAVTDLSPTTYGTLLDTLTKAPNDKRRNIDGVILVVNPSDYFTKVFPATTVRRTDGSYGFDVFPYPTKVIQSNAVPAGKAVIGLGKKYFLGLGTGIGGKLEFSDEYKFLEDQRIYRIKLYGNGRPLDENAFVLLDISGLKPNALQVEVIGTIPEA